MDSEIAPRGKGVGNYIRDIAAREHEGDGPTTRVGQRVDFGRASAARAADALIFLPPLPPLAERCAFTAEEFDKDFHRRPAGLRERVEQVHPNALGGPADIAIVERFLWPVARQSGWKRCGEQDGQFGGRGEEMIVAPRQ